MFFDESKFDLENISKGDIVLDSDIKRLVVAKGRAKISLSTPIYKIFPIERFTELMLMRTIAFTHPKKWDDPAEYSYIVRHQELAGIPVCKDKDFDLYGQCWSMNKSCDGLWRTYTNNKQKLAVQVQSTVGSLLKAYASRHKEILGHLFCGKVVYEATEKLQRANKDSKPSSLQKEMDSLFYKRKDFAYEQEVRLVVNIMPKSQNIFENASKVRASQYALFLFDDLKWIDRCVVSPWASPMEVAMVQTLSNFSGIQSKCVTKSDLYEEWR